MKFFGTVPLYTNGSDGKRHALVAAVKSAWTIFCHTRSTDYETVDSNPQSTTEPVVWEPDRERIDCEVCKQLLDGKTIDELVEWKQVTP